MAAVLHTLVSAIAAYAAVVIVLRAAGKRVLSKWNSFDLVVTVAVGSALGSTIVSGQTSLAQGTAAFAALAGLQYAVTRISVQSARFEQLLKARATLLLAHGQYLHQAMKKERVTKSEICAAVRAKGYAAVEDVHAVVLETDGSFSIIGNISPQKISAFEGVEGSTSLSDVPGIASLKNSAALRTSGSA